MASTKVREQPRAREPLAGTFAKGPNDARQEEEQQPPHSINLCVKDRLFGHDKDVSVADCLSGDILFRCG